MYIILPIVILFIFNNIAQRKNEELLKLNCEDMYFQVSFIGLGKDTFVMCSKNALVNVNNEISQKAENDIYRKKIYEYLRVRSDTPNIIVGALYEKNKREWMHSIRVSRLCMMMGEVLELSEDEVKELKIAGLLHDIGKIGVEESILNKKEKLTESEWNRIKKHPEIGFRILSSVKDMYQISKYVLAHHERWNGGGYPKSLKKEEIPFQSRIISIADAYDAMTNMRSYGSVLSEKQAIRELQENAYTQFEPKLVQVFIEKVLNRYFYLN